MKIILAANAQIAKKGIGYRVGEIAKQVSKENEITIFGRTIPSQLKQQVTWKKPIPAAKWIAYAIEFFRFYISTKNKLFKKAFVTFQTTFDKRIAKKLQPAQIYHNWESFPWSFKKAKELGMITIKDCVIQNDEGAAKLFPEIEHYKGSKTTPEEKEALKYIDYLFVPCEFVRQSYEAIGVPSQKIITVPFGANIEKFKPKQKDEKTFTIAYVGVIRARKNLKTIMQAILELENEGKLKNYEFKLAGRVCADARTEIQEYAKKIKQMKLLGNIPHEEVNELMGSASIFVYPSLAESSAKANYEALACGLPLLTTFQTGTVARDGKEGFIVEPFDVEGFKEKIMLLYNDRNLLKEMSENARKRAKEFTWEKYAQNVENTYRNILKEHKV